MVKRNSLLLVLALALMLPALPAQEKPKVAPPPALNENKGESPHPGFAWKAGYYRWSGAHYRWRMGHWVNPPRPGGVWVPGVWVKHEDHWEYKDGHWKYE